jgi:formamidopyrimidine-DNA glycosylase
MPELPEVETIRRDLAKKIAGRKIISIEIRDKKLGEAKNFARFLAGKKIIFAGRVGKLLVFKISGGKFLLIHLKMTGQLVYQEGKKIIAGGHEILINSLIKKGGSGGARQGVLWEKIGGELPNKHTRMIIFFANGQKLFFNDARRFGYAKIAGEKELAEIRRGYGIEPLKADFTLANFAKILAGKKISIKAALLDQKNISGIGNIYASEILFAAGVRPSRPAGSLKKEEVAGIFRSAEKVLKKAIKHRGTTFSDYVDAGGKKGNFSRFLKVYEREGEKCRVCGKAIKNVKLGGRSTYFCPKCQK